LAARGRSEFRYLNEVLGQHAAHAVRIPWTAHPIETIALVPQPSIL
jgi:hypothetical protein